MTTETMEKAKELKDKIQRDYTFARAVEKGEYTVYHAGGSYKLSGYLGQETTKIIRAIIIAAAQERLAEAQAEFDAL